MEMDIIFRLESYPQAALFHRCKYRNIFTSKQLLVPAISDCFLNLHWILRSLLELITANDHLVNFSRFFSDFLYFCRSIFSVSLLLGFSCFELKQLVLCFLDDLQQYVYIIENIPCRKNSN